ncbi:GAP family protein [Mycobacterium sp. NPDC049093]
MWGPLLLLAVLFTVNPVRLGIILLVLSRPRPMQNLLVYWIGILVVGLAYLLIPLVLLHSTPTSAALTRSFGQPTESPTVQLIVITTGALLLLIAIVLVTRSFERTPSSRAAYTRDRGQDADEPGGKFDLATLPAISRLVRPAQDTVPEKNSRIQRMLASARDAWQSGSPWISLIIGLMVLPADGVVFALALIVASGAGIAMQIGAAIVFLIVALSVEEVILVSNLVAPEKTEVVLRRLHELALAHHRKFMAAILALVGVSLIVRATGVI